MATIADLIDAGLLRPYHPPVWRPGDAFEAQVLCTAPAWDFLLREPDGMPNGHYLASIDVLRAQVAHFVLGRGARYFLPLGGRKEGIGKFAERKLRLAGWRQSEHVIVACFGYHRDDVATKLGGYGAIKDRIFRERAELGLGAYYKGA
ncbi:hypothetical protein STAQ_40410 [Allostella sp. ATCC 35155]|nr:hypothetical protein STAQ_40410 [Stella sp. ATCC 35155]